MGMPLAHMHTAYPLRVHSACSGLRLGAGLPAGPTPPSAACGMSRSMRLRQHRWALGAVPACSRADVDAASGCAVRRGADPAACCCFLCAGRKGCAGADAAGPGGGGLALFHRDLKSEAAGRAAEEGSGSRPPPQRPHQHHSAQHSAQHHSAALLPAACTTPAVQPFLSGHACSLDSAPKRHIAVLCVTARAACAFV